MASTGISRAFWFFTAVGTLYAILLGALTHPQLQRHALYANKLHTASWHDLTKPESFGFAKNQVSPLSIVTPDGETLFAWHVLPLSLYARNQEQLLAQSKATDYHSSPAHSLLHDDPTAALIINFHGNAGHLAQGERPGSLRALAALPQLSTASNVHILTFDYRGFGHSSGSPTEDGLITDALAVLEYARVELGVPPHRTVLMATSLGTAVVAGALDALANKTAATSAGLGYAGVVLTGAFDSLATLLPTYAIGGAVPLLGPIAGYPKFTRYVLKTLVDTWQSGERWTRLCSRAAEAGNGHALRLQVLHARNDHDIQWRHGDMIYESCLRGLSHLPQLKATPPPPVSKDLAERDGWQSSPFGGGVSGRWQRQFAVAGALELRQTLLEWGGHNQLVWHAPVVLAVWDVFEAAAAAAAAAAA